MPERASTHQGEEGPASSLRPALLLVGAVFVARVVYAIAACPYDLVEDEAHYWLWSRHLDWSYYSKGPGIAWAIWLSTRVFGHAEWAVRLPTIVAHAIGALACAGLVRDIARRAFVGDGSVAAPARAAVLAAGAFMLAPAFQLTGVLVTIDGCYLACWALASWAAWRALGEGSRWAWVGLGAALGVGFLFKYTILLLIPGLVVFALVQRGHARREGASGRQRAAGLAVVVDEASGARRPLGDFIESPGLRLARRWRWWMAAGLGVFVLGLAPVVIWNWREGWPTVRHLLGHLGMAGGDMPVAAGGGVKGGGGGGYKVGWTVVYVLAPLGMIGPLLVLALTAAARVLGPSRLISGERAERRMGVHYLLSLFVPIWAFYLVVSFIAEPEQNWSIAGFVSMTALAGWYAADELARRRAGARDASLTARPRARTRPIKVMWKLGVIYGVVAGAFLHRADLAAAGLNRIAAVPAVKGAIERGTGKPFKPIVTGRLIGAEQMAGHVDRLLEGLRASTGREPFVMCEHYGRASQMAYYLHRRGSGAAVLSPQSVMGGRRSQFDYWADTDLSRPDLIGRPAVLMSNDKPHTLEHWARMFERVEPIDAPGQKLEGEHKRDRVAYIGLGYRGPGK